MKPVKTMKRIGVIVSAVAFTFFGVWVSVQASSTFIVQQGGTGANTFAGGLVGANGTNPLYGGNATTTVTCSGSTTCTSFVALGGSPITITSSSGSGSISTSTALANGQVDFSTGVATIGNDSNFIWDNTNKRLGIGTTSPFGQLSINPDALGSGVPEFVIGSSTATHFVVTGHGNVGIGTAAPNAALHVMGDTSNDITLNLQQTNTVNVGVEFSATGSNGVWNLGVDRRNTNTSTANNFYISNGATLATNPRLTISTAGNVGIGTTTPAAPLDVALVTGAASVEALRLEVTGNKAVGRGPSLNFYTPNGTGADELSASIAGLTTGSPQSGYLAFLTANGATPTEAVRITAADSVGIGSTTPYAKLSVSGFTTNTPGLVVDALSGFTGNLADFKLASSTLFSFRQDGVFSATGEVRAGSSAFTTTGVRIGSLSGTLQLGGVQGSGSTGNSATAEIDLNGISQASNPGVIQFRTGTASVNNQSEVARIAANGNFGIGTTTPWTVLEVASNTPQIGWTNPNAGTNLKHWYSYLDGNGALNFGTSSDALATSTNPYVLTLANSGNVGIGSSTPGFLFSTVNTWITSLGEMVGYDLTNGWFGRVSPTRSFALQTGTTTPWTASTTGTAYSPYVIMPYTGILRQIYCTTDSSFLGVNVQVNGSNATPSYFIASTTVGNILFTGGNTFTKGQKILINVGTTTTSLSSSISCTADATETQ